LTQFTDVRKHIPAMTVETLLNMQARAAVEEPSIMGSEQVADVSGEGAVPAAKRARSQTSASPEPEEDPCGEEFFAAYDDLSVHLLMLHDQSRVGAYVAGVRANRASIEGKVVLDVGAGSGVLSMLAAKHGGAQRVYAVEAATGMARLAASLVERNGLSDVVRVIEGRLEDVTLPEKVDVIISEWMGFYLLHESMLGSVITAREKWLKDDGLLLPSSANLWAAVLEGEEFHREVEGLSDVHGLDFSSLAATAVAGRCKQPSIEDVGGNRLLTNPLLVASLDLRTVTSTNLHALDKELSFVALRAGRAAGVCLWFDVNFIEPLKSSAPCVILSTAPGVPLTHWKQTAVYFGSFPCIEAGDELPLRLLLRQSTDNPRQYDISVET